ncbi:MAG: hypothetical protein JWQ98_2099 [Chlorobi bacterium]|nr:hypothetical protein [Chlorobiota bacterium]
MATTRSGASKRTPSRQNARQRGAGSKWGLPENIETMVPTKYHTLLFVGLILFSLLCFFGGVIFTGKYFATNDNISWLSFVPYLDKMDAAGQHPFWIPYIFSGMPAFASYLVTGNRWWDLSMTFLGSAEHIVGFANYWVTRVVFHYFIYGTGMYLLMRSKKAARSTSFFVSIAAMFSTWIIIYIMIGHNTKIGVLMTFPYIFLCLERLIKRWSLLYTGLLILAVHFMNEQAHPQTMFYGACAVGIYLLFEFIGTLMEKNRAEMIGVLRAGLMIAMAAGFAYGMGMDRYKAIAEYTPYSTRGSSAITGAKNGEKEDGGHGYDYATQYSFSPGEMLTYICPSAYGFGHVRYSDPDHPDQSQVISTYWGQMPFTDAAHYMGVAVLILGLFGGWMNRKNRFVLALMMIGLFGLVLSFGNTFPLLYNLFYNYFPNFNKFRAPSQSLVLLEFIFPLLAGFGIESLIAMHKAGDNPKVDKSLVWIGIGFVATCLLGLGWASISRSDYMTMLGSSQHMAQYPEQVKDFIYNMMQNDWLMSAFFGGATFAAMYMYARARITPITFKVVLLAILLFDLWRVDSRPMDPVTKEQAFSVFNKTDVDDFLDQDSTKYRIMDLTQQPDYPARQFHENVLGYSSTKMRIYQDLMDVTSKDGSNIESQTALDMLNTKYVVTFEQPGQEPAFRSKDRSEQGHPVVVYKNPKALPRAWFVNKVETAPKMKTLEMLRDNTFDPHDVAYVVNPLPARVDPVGYAASAPAAPTDSTHPAPAAGNGTVTIARWEPNSFSIDVNAPGPGSNFLVISEIYYPPSWKATIDGKPAEVYQTNYLLRGLIVPAGKHTVEMHYESAGFDSGRYTSLALNIVTILLIGVGVFMERRTRHRDEEDPVHNAPEILEDDV